MSLTVDISGGGKDFEQVENLLQGAVLADIVDKGLVPNKFKKAEPGKPQPMQRKGYFVWIVEELDADGRNKRVFESFTFSMHPKSGLRKRYKELTGKKDAEIDALKTVDLEPLIGTQRYLVMSQEDGEGGKVFIKIQSTMKLSKGQTAPSIPADFVRKQDRTE